MKKCIENLCQRVSVTLGQRSFNGQNYAIICPNLTYLFMMLFVNSAIR